MTPPAIGAERKRELRLFAKSLEVRFKSLELLNLSLIHRSVSNEGVPAAALSVGRKVNNERLEFLGDAVLGAIAASLLYGRFPGKTEGELAKIKSVVVSEEILSGIALELGIDKFLTLGKGEEQTGGRTKRAILADAMEALIGAIYLDSGFAPVRDFVAARLNPEIDRVLEKKVSQDYKSLLQELSQRRYRAYPVYRLVNRSGPEHQRLFWVEVTVQGKKYGPSTGHSKKAAEQAAARLAWEKLETGLPMDHFTKPG
ncbi:MAG: ribonuclease III [Spirochaetaceae bacterium]|nr:ribonuclease III [Spirochaetaceae bacterium]